MALSTRLELRQGQQLVMTPQLQQAIRLLQLSNMELSTFVDEELERNPLLERKDQDAEPNPRTIDTPDPTETAVPGSEWADQGEALDLSKPATDPVAALDTEIENVCPDAARTELVNEGGSDGPMLGGQYGEARSNASSFSDDDANLEAYLASAVTLTDHLDSQLALAARSARELLIGRRLIDHIDDAGYFTGDIALLADQLGTRESEIESALAIIQTFDPPGIGARTLAECLSLQLKDQNRYDPQIAAVLERLDLVAARKMQALAKHAQCDLDDVSDMIGEIRRLDPKPGLRFGFAALAPVVPDVFVRQGGDGAWLIELNQETLPRVLINRSYFARVSTSATAGEDKSYLLECLQTANWLVKSLDQRARTILKVTEEIVRQQDGFLMHGVEHLRPLNLRTVADAIQMHESTVSRVTSNKYMATPRGIFELKYFFTSSIASASGEEAHSSEAVRHRIKLLIEAETARGVLSDDKIVEKLKTDGIDIARRTVAKYRESLRIPSSVQRRREKQMNERLVRTP